MGIDLYMVTEKGDNVAGNKVFPALLGGSMVKADSASTDYIRGNVATRLINIFCEIDIRSMDDDTFSIMVSNDQLKDIVTAMSPKRGAMVFELSADKRHRETARQWVHELYTWLQHHAELGHHMRVTR
jgi:hypothetical protein